MLNPSPAMTTPANPLQRAHFRCISRIEVRWAEVDAQKIVFNAHYLLYADIAVADYWRQLALPYEASFAALGGDLFVKKATTTYHAAATLGDILHVGIRCAQVGTSSMRFEVGIFRALELLNSIELIYVYAHPTERQPLPVPRVLRDLLAAFESGNGVVRVETGTWAALRAAAEPLRRAVFIEEQGVAPEIELDALDAQALHAVVFNALDQPVATGRLLDAGGSARIGRMAVDRGLRGGRWGQVVLDALLAAARQKGFASATLHAQCHAQSFYRRAGFVPEGAVFEEAGIPHIAMRRRLQD